MPKIDQPLFEDICTASWTLVMSGGHGDLAVRVDRNSAEHSILRVTLFDPETKGWLTSYVLERGSDLLYCDSLGDAARTFLGLEDIGAPQDSDRAIEAVAFAALASAAVDQLRKKASNDNPAQP